MCVSECLLSIGGHTVGPTELKFGKEDDIYPGRLQDAFCSGTPSPGSGEAKEWFLRSMQPKPCISVSEKN